MISQIKLLLIALVTGGFLLSAYTSPESGGPKPPKKASTPMVAPTPPMGWNSFDAYDCRINEKEFKNTVDYMSKNLLKYGWNYAVIDYIWFNDEPGKYPITGRRFGHPDVRLNADGSPIDKLVMDKYGRLLPSLQRFPSIGASSNGFKAIADYVHSKGMKFGIHIMRGIPRQAYFENLPIKGTKYTARDIAEPWDLCSWNNNMYGVDPTKPGAQEYYNSLFELYAAWGVDFIKADDTMYPPYHKGEIEMISKALQNCGRPMVLSLSCGEAPLSQANHLVKNANMWRISADFWDDWEDLKHNFDLMNAWSPHIKPNHWPDADMLPIGRLSLNNRPKDEERLSKFTKDEHYTLMSLWCISRSPLIIGADLLSTPDSTVKTFLQNEEVIAINQNSTDNRQVRRDNNKVVWVATDPKTGDRYLGLFNLTDSKTKVNFNMELEYMRDTYKVRDLWAKKELGNFSKEFSVELNAHSAGLYRLTSVSKPATVSKTQGAPSGH